MRIALNVLCGFTLAACLWLSVMFVVLHRPGFERGLAMSLMFVAQSLLTLAVVNHRLAARAWRIPAGAGAAGIVWAGGNAIAQTLNSQHFEGFALLIGAALVLQGLLTGQDLITTHFTSSSKVHQFGN
jgi:hypothetical protein